MFIYLNLIFIALIHNNKKDEAQLLIDLKKELNDFNDKFFEKKINYLMGYTITEPEYRNIRKYNFKFSFISYN